MASRNVPRNKTLYAEVKAAAQAKFDVYPSAYANAWLVREYKKRGGTYKVESAKPKPKPKSKARKSTKSRGRKKKKT